MLIDVDYARTRQAFEELSGNEFDAFSKEFQSELFAKHECGVISDDTFRSGIRESLDIDSSDTEIDLAWNAILGSFPEERLNKVEECKKNFRTFLLSNTNSIHQASFENTIENTFGLKKWQNAFERILYSHKIGKRKPHVETFQYVASILEVDPSKTLFIDDSPQHIEGAAKAGFRTHHLTSDHTILDLNFVPI